MLAYGGALREQGWGTIVARSLRRGFEIYAAFLLLVIAYLVLIWIAGGGCRHSSARRGLHFWSWLPRFSPLKPSSIGAGPNCF